MPLPGHGDAAVSLDSKDMLCESVPPSFATRNQIQHGFFGPIATTTTRAEPMTTTTTTTTAMRAQVSANKVRGKNEARPRVLFGSVQLVQDSLSLTLVFLSVEKPFQPLWDGCGDNGNVCTHQASIDRPRVLLGNETVQIVVCPRRIMGIDRYIYIYIYPLMVCPLPHG